MILEDRTKGRMINLDVTEAMKKIGISQFFLKRNDFVIKFHEGGMRCCPFDCRIPSVGEIMKKMRQRLKNEPNFKSWSEALLDIENQLLERSEEIFSYYPKAPNAVPAEIGEQNSTYINKVTKLKKELEGSDFTFEYWQLSIEEKYKKIRAVTEKNFPNAWPMMQFCLAIKSILNIEGCTLPFMGVILAIPSSMKTLVIQLFRKYPYSLYSDNFTPSSFQSHNAALNEEQLRKNDLLPKLHNALFLTPELAPIFTANEDDLRKSLGIITRVLDGHGLETDSGAQGHRKYGNTFFVWVGAAVEIPYRVWTLLGTLGHKIYFLRPDIPEKTVEDLEKIAKENDFINKFEETENALLEYLVAFEAAPMSSNTRIDHNGRVKVKWNENKSSEQDQAIECIARVANLLKRLRGIVYISQSKTRPSKYSSKSPSVDNNSKINDKNGEEFQDSNFIITDESDYDTDYPIVEDPSRAVILLRNLALGNAISQGRSCIKLDDMSLVINVAISTTTRARSELIKLLLRCNGQVTTSEVVKMNKVSAPFAKRAMRELAAVGIVEISALTGYSNSELKITLRDEYSWFMETEFKQLLQRQKSVSNSSSDGNSSIETMCASTLSFGQIVGPGDNHKYSQSGQLTLDSSDNSQSQSHAETTSTMDTHIKNAIACDNLEFTSTHDNDCHLTENSNQFGIIETDNDGQSKVVSADNPEICDNLQEKNNAPLWGSESCQHMTQSHYQSQNYKSAEEDNDSSDEVMNFIITSMVNIIRTGKGSILSLDSILRTIYDQNENVREHLGDKITQRENRKIRKIYLAIIHFGDSIEVVKTRPQVTVRWVNDSNSGRSDTL